MVITDQDPEDFYSIPHPEYSAEQIKNIAKILERFRTKDLAYRYGHIIRFVYGDQVEAVKKAFKEKAETFRTVMSLWNPCESIRKRSAMHNRNSPAHYWRLSSFVGIYPHK